MDKKTILSEIRKTAVDGSPLGMDRFKEATGIRKEDWLGIYWARWSDAIIEAGLEPNKFGSEAIDYNWMIEQIATLIEELGRYPAKAEFKLKKKSDEQFPNVGTIRSHLGTKPEIIVKVLEFCQNVNRWQKVIGICRPLAEQFPVKETELNVEADSEGEIGYVYLLKHDKTYKIGRSIDVTRRYKEIRTQMPHKMEEIHVIETDDPSGIEAYWHNRFKDKRLEGEWFSLSPSDVKAFRKRKFM